ncbi:MAG: acyl-ACP--UDP-N-acetylglucosamine O-acyltransferase [Mariprofundaceae bacterium]|nr:acyl-ACP--UDP-N-acetylglucosamine O-acyltransferase [Mariprofundaceae bacterium]
MSVSVHSTAVVSDKAALGEGVSVGPYCVIDAHVRVGNGTQLMSHVVLSGRTILGENNRVFPFASIGHEPQDLKYHGEASEVVIGDGNTIRENVTINPGTEGGGMVTAIGDNNLLMAYSHVAHDCRLGDDIVMANCATLAGHVFVDDGAIIGGMSAIHQFLRIGRYAMIGGMSGIVKDVPPFCLTAGGYRPGLVGLNLVGLKRQGIATHRIRLLKEVYRILLQGNERLDQRLAEANVLAEGDDCAEHLVAFVGSSKKGFTVHRRDQS